LDVPPDAVARFQFPHATQLPLIAGELADTLLARRTCWHMRVDPRQITGAQETILPGSERFSRQFESADLLFSHDCASFA
jgi:hypothetical protein